MLTFEAIRDLERGEAESKTLQKLPLTFLDELREYMARKENMNDKTSADLHEIENVKRSIRRLLELREKKLVEQALYTVRTGYPAENVAAAEERLYHFLVEEIKNYRESFFRLLSSPMDSAPVMAEEPKPIEAVKEPLPEPLKAQEIQEPAPAPAVEARARYRVTRAMPRFVGPDMNVYELKESQTVEEGQIPKPLNDLLLKKGLLEVVL
ncbi:MAG: DNA replication complex GINS family protein [Candidatus Aenigmarchaeota archaeon]|nr:DNA replication complex GINS family protein [Candidatus Aenigmarchaeota archaeon]